ARRSLREGIPGQPGTRTSEEEHLALDGRPGRVAARVTGEGCDAAIAPLLLGLVERLVGSVECTAGRVVALDRSEADAHRDLAHLGKAVLGNPLAQAVERRPGDLEGRR